MGQLSYGWGNSCAGTGRWDVGSSARSFCNRVTIGVPEHPCVVLLPAC
jgi:hypothetical protein